MSSRRLAATDADTVRCMPRAPSIPSSMHSCCTFDIAASRLTRTASRGSDARRGGDMTLHADHIGSLLRPPELLEARAAHDRGDLGDEALERAEDDAIIAALEV